MTVAGIGSNYNVYDSAYSAQKNMIKQEEPKTAIKAESEKHSVSSKVSDYNSYLSKTYDCVRNGNVAIAGSYLRQCANDPEKAKELEESLSLYNELHEKGYKNALANAQKHGMKLIQYSESWAIDDKGNITSTTSTTVVIETGNKSKKELKEEQEERLKEKKEAERIEEKKREEKELEKQQEESKKDTDSLTEYKAFDISI